jgi:hypothetical protein
LGGANLSRPDLNATSGPAWFNPNILKPIDPLLVFSPTNTWVGWAVQYYGPGNILFLGTP